MAFPCTVTTLTLFIIYVHNDHSRWFGFNARATRRTGTPTAEKCALVKPHDRVRTRIRFVRFERREKANVTSPRSCAIVIAVGDVCTGSVGGGPNNGPVGVDVSARSNARVVTSKPTSQRIVAGAMQINGRV